ncbi:MAG: hypothetical protein NC314_08260 [Roseburia sp.]|nr:hypothetical protein [Ruminococcus sp.]MCM1155703.1 hypothetical protein [Roseburia sp.]MCM1242818.1 hypothetical protein [Roseburia sp.]
MENFYKEIWNNVEIACDYAKSEEIEFDGTKRVIFEKKCRELIDIVEQYMNTSSETLDRHKMAAILIIAIIKAEPLVCKKKHADSVFVANYVIAVEVGLSYMRELLNEILETLGENLIDKYFFPESWICENGYFRVFYRNLYFTNTNVEWELNPLDIAEKLFLLEYITLLKKGIAPTKLNEEDSKC